MNSMTLLVMVTLNSFHFLVTSGTGMAHLLRVGLKMESLSVLTILQLVFLGAILLSILLERFPLKFSDKVFSLVYYLFMASLLGRVLLLLYLLIQRQHLLL